MISFHEEAKNATEYSISDNNTIQDLVELLVHNEYDSSSTTNTSLKV